MRKVLLDTDIGTDVDDAVCLAYLLAREDCDLVGITTVTGQADLRARLASVLCIQAGIDVPIFPGAREPLVGEQRQRIAEQATVLERWPHTEAFPEDAAVEFMLETIRRHPGEVTLLSIGPLTNVARLLKADPGIAHQLDQLVLMGGLFGPSPPGYGPVEWNIGGDPHAAATVYAAPVRSHRSVGIDVTHRVHLSMAEFRESFSSPLFRPVQEMATVWFNYLEGSTFHDPLAAVAIFEPHLCGFHRGRVSVDLAGLEPGATKFEKQKDGPHEVAVTVDPDAFFAHFKAVVG